MAQQNGASTRFSVAATSINLGSTPRVAEITVSCDPPPPPPGAIFAVVSGPCVLDAGHTCIFDSNPNGNYGVGDSCVFQVNLFTHPVEH